MTSIKKSQIEKSIEFCEKNGYFDKLNEIYSRVPKGDCSGCGNCCMESVGINLVEFLNIYRHLQKDEKLQRESIKRIAEYYFLELIKKNSCPFKDENNRCKIYEVRPLNCRIFGHWRKEDYNKNLERVININKEYRDSLKREYGVDIHKEVMDFSIKYCEKFIPEHDYMSKSQRLSYSDELIVLDSKILAGSNIHIDYKDRGIVEYFIESLLCTDFAYKVKIRISKEKNIKIVDRIKQILAIKMI